MKYDYYKVSIPGDLSENMEDLVQAAIAEARERIRKYSIPCEWQVRHLSGVPGDYEVQFQVRRKRY